MTLILSISLAITWFILGWKCRELEAMRRIQKYEENMKTQVKQNIIPVVVEKAGDLFHVYNKETGEYLAKGSNVNEITENLSQRFNDHKVFVASPENMKEVGLKDAA